MKQNANKENQTPPAPKRGMSDFKKAMMWTAISIVVLSPIALVAAIIAAIVFGVKGQGQIAGGIWAGLWIGIGIIIVALGITCFALIASL